MRLLVIFDPTDDYEIFMVNIANLFKLTAPFLMKAQNVPFKICNLLEQFAALIEVAFVLLIVEVYNPIVLEDKSPSISLVRALWAFLVLPLVHLTDMIRQIANFVQLWGAIRGWGAQFAWYPFSMCLSLVQC